MYKRQVHGQIKIVEEKLLFYEEKLKLYEKSQKIKALVQDLDDEKRNKIEELI